jgi:hypothetical protein
MRAARSVLQLRAIGRESVVYKRKERGEREREREKKGEREIEGRDACLALVGALMMRTSAV